MLLSCAAALRAPPLPRRALPSLGAAAAAAAWPRLAVLAAPPLSEELRMRLELPLLASPGVTPSADAPPLPAWLEGRWRCEQTLRAFSTPQGVQFIGAAGRPLSEAEASAAQTRQQIGTPVTLELRFVADGWGGCVEDRAFNAASRLDAFAGRSVVREATVCEAPGSAGGAAASCVLVRFKGPVTQTQQVNSLRVAEAADGVLRTSEFRREVFARQLAPGDTRNFPPITTDSEVLLELRPAASPQGAGGTAGAAPADVPSAAGRLRLVSYLQPLDPLFFAAGRKSVALSDYDVRLTRLPGAVYHYHDQRERPALVDGASEKATT